MHKAGKGYKSFAEDLLSSVPQADILWRTQQAILKEVREKNWDE